MSFVDRHLLPGESVRYHTRLHWNVYLRPAAFTLVLLLPLAVLALISTHPLLALIPAAVACAVLAQAWLRRRSSEFAVTNKRVIIKLGILTTRSIELLLPKIEAIEVEQSMPGRMFGYGGIVVTGSGGTHERFTDIARPLDFREAVQAATAGDPTAGG